MKNLSVLFISIFLFSIGYGNENFPEVDPDVYLKEYDTNPFQAEGKYHTDSHIIFTGSFDSMTVKNGIAEINITKSYKNTNFRVEVFNNKAYLSQLNKKDIISLICPTDGVVVRLGILFVNDCIPYI